jgi:hypothetical protein
MAKSDCGLPAKSGATKMYITREEYDLNCARISGLITFDEYEKRFKKLKKRGLIRRR